MRSISDRNTTDSPIRLGLRENWEQFTLLVIVNVFVGGMIGMERTVVPLLAKDEFGRASVAVALSFIVAFGIVKALANLVAGRFSDRYGRKQMLIAGWIAGIPVPILIMLAPDWSWVVIANLLLGVNQGLCWSTTVIMKIDLVGPRQRGLAMGLNEAAGYFAVGAAALASGWIASSYGLRPEPFYLGVAMAVAGLSLSALAVRETRSYAELEARAHERQPRAAQPPSFREVFAWTSWKDRSLFAVSQAGLTNNMNDGMAWGLLPLFFIARGLDLDQIAIIAATYPAVWGVCQLGTGALSDKIGRKWLIVAGMWVQALAIFMVVVVDGFANWLVAAILLGLGTAMVYPTLLAAVSDVALPTWRATALGVYRFWRDIGFAVGAILAGVTGDLLGLRWSIGLVGLLTLGSGVVVAAAMTETHPRKKSTMAGTAPDPLGQTRPA